MIDYYTIIVITFFHFLFDFKFQSRAMAESKSHNAESLTEHVFIYSLGLAVMAGLCWRSFGSWETPAALINVFGFIGINAALHWFTDWMTSKATTLLWKESRTGEFFDMIGFDQFLHTAALFGTFIWLT